MGMNTVKRHCTEGTLQAIESLGCFKDGHFHLKSGRHSNKYGQLRFAELIRLTSPFLNYSLKKLGVQHGDTSIVLVGPKTMGREIATYMAGSQEIPYAWCEIDDKEGKAYWPDKPGDFADIVKDRKVILLDDMLTKGTTTRQVVKLVEDSGGGILAALFIARRNQDTTAETIGVPRLDFLVDLEFPDWEISECPLCAGEVPLDKIGHWKEFHEKFPDYPLKED